MSLTERWLPVPGYEDRYEVTDDGRVRSLRFTNRMIDRKRVTPKILKPTAGTGNYLFVTLCRAGTVRTHAIHRLVLQVFGGPSPRARMHAAHLDGNPRNNLIANLAWATPAENEAHKELHGRRKHGVQKPNARLTEALVIQMRERRASGESLISIGRDMGMSEGQVLPITSGRIWSHVGGPLTLPGTVNCCTKLDHRKASEIRARHASGETYAAIALQFRVSRSLVAKVCRGESWVAA